jgi:hypothetical protein
MKVSKKLISSIRDKAIQNHIDCPTELHWSKDRDDMDRKMFQTVSFLRAVNEVLDLGLDIDVYKRDGSVYEKFK